MDCPPVLPAENAADDGKVASVVPGLKSRNVKLVPVSDGATRSWSRSPPRSDTFQKSIGPPPARESPGLKEPAVAMVWPGAWTIDRNS
jgi:hypothetical protein